MWRSAPETLRNLLSKYQRECLFQEESPRKADKRYKLEEIARRFVCELPHGSKFACQPVEALLRRAVEEAAPACFDPLQAAAAFAALEDYAVNLLVQPWRGEVHQVKLYSGYYKHTVERQLKNAQVVLQLMGYEKKEEGVLQLTRAVDAATLSDVALDCLIASAECQVLAAIMEGLKECSMPMSWKEVYRFRRECSCDPEDSVRTLLQRQKHKSAKHMVLPEMSGSEPLFSWHDIPTNDIPDLNSSLLVQMPTNGTWPSQVASHWQSYLDPPLMEGDDSKWHVTNYRPSPKTYGTKHCDGLYMGIPDCLGKPSGDGDSYPPLVDVYGTPSSSWGDVPSVTHNTVGDISRAADRAPLRYDTIGREHYPPSASACYGQSSASGLASQICDDVRSSAKEPHLTTPPVATLCQEMKSVSLGSGPNSREMNGSSVLHESSSANTNSLQMPQRDMVFGDALDAAVVVETAKRYLDAQVAEETSSHDKQVWSCGACTFLNAPERDVCEMCSKSRHLGPEMMPLLSGGKQCPVCTLVNDRQAKACSVCSHSLKDSPTYI